MLADDPAELAELFAKLQGKDAVRSNAGQLLIMTARGRVSVLDRAKAAERFGDALPQGPQTPHFIGYRVSVANVAKTKALFDESGIRYRAAAGTLQISPADAFNTIIEFAPT